MLKTRDSLGLDFEVEEKNGIVQLPVKKNGGREKNNRDEIILLSKQKNGGGLHVPAIFNKKGTHPFDEVEW